MLIWSSVIVNVETKLPGNKAYVNVLPEMTWKKQILLTIIGWESMACIDILCRCQQYRLSMEGQWE